VRVFKTLFRLDPRAEVSDPACRFAGESNSRHPHAGVGLGGLGSHVAQQLAYLGVCDSGIVDFDVVTESNMNRLVGAVEADVTAATKKIVVAERTIKAIKPDATVTALDAKVGAPEVEAVIAGADVVFGCLDRDLPRLQLTELCARYAKPVGRGNPDSRLRRAVRTIRRCSSS
jgi:molybdopterin/thiamine biosynthesis adenylyltransferase